MKTTTKNSILVIALLALVSLMIAPVMAETLTGTLGGSNFTQMSYSLTNVEFSNSGLNTLYINDIETTGNLYSIILSPGKTMTSDAGSPSGYTTPFTMYAKTAFGGTRVDQIPVGSGTFGYQKIYNAAIPPVQQTTGYLWLVLDSWNITGRSGDIFLELNYTPSGLYNITIDGQNVGGKIYVPSGGVGWHQSNTDAVTTGAYLVSKYYITSCSYSATKPGGLGISGYVTKTGNSRMFIESSTGTTLASNNLADSLPFNFSVSASQIYIKMLDASNNWWNSSILFAAPTPTPTPYTSLYSIEVIPNYGEITGSYSATSTYAGSPIGSNVNAFTIICTSGTVSGTCLSNATTPVFIKKGDGFWYQRDLIQDTKLTTAFPSPVVLTFSAPGTYTIEGAYFETTGGGGKAYDTVTIVSTGISKTFTVKVQDATTSGFIYGSEVQIINTSGWSNATTTNGIRVFNAKIGEILGYSASADADGYLPSSLLYTQVTGDMERTVSLTKYISVPAGNTTLYVFVKDSRNLNPISGVLVRLNDGQMKTTPSTGLSTFTVLNGSLYTITTTKTGYYPLTRSMIVVTTSNQISMEMNPIYATTATPTGEPTQDVRDDTKKATDAFSKWIAVLGDITDIAIGVVIIWLMWITVYMITGGKIIDKIMKRGRGRR